MILVEGIFNHGDGATTRFLINNDGSWQQWGGNTEQMGKTVDYVTSMAQGLATTNYFAQAEAPVTPETPEMDQEPTATDDRPTDEQVLAVLEGVTLDEEPASFATFGDLALWYSMKAYEKGTAELTKQELKYVKKTVKRMVRENPELLPAAERDRHNI